MFASVSVSHKMFAHCYCYPDTPSDSVSPVWGIFLKYFLVYFPLVCPSSWGTFCQSLGRVLGDRRPNWESSIIGTNKQLPLPSCNHPNSLPAPSSYAEDLCFGTKQNRFMALENPSWYMTTLFSDIAIMSLCITMKVSKKKKITKDVSYH